MMTNQRLHPKILENRRKIGELITNRRNEIEFSQRKLAIILGCKAPYLAQIEKGNVSISKRFKKIISAVLDIKLSSLDEGNCNFHDFPFKKIAKIIKDQRKKLNMSQIDLACSLWTNASVVSRVENEKARISLSKIDEWSNILKVPRHVLRPDYFKNPNCSRNDD